MTRIIYLPDAQTTILLDHADNAASLAKRIRDGDWMPPLPLADPAGLSVVELEEVVIVTSKTSQPDQDIKLTHRQLEVMEGIMQGLTIQQIALKLKISPRTVSYHASHIKARLGAGTLAQAVAQMVKPPS